MQTKDLTSGDSSSEVEQLRRRLEEAEETLNAIRTGQVDALVVSGPYGEQVFVLNGVEQPYRVFVESMNEGALTVHADGAICSSNRRFAEMVKTPLERVIGVHFKEFVAPDYRDRLGLLLAQGLAGDCRGEFPLLSEDGNTGWAVLSLCPVQLNHTTGICLIATNITEIRRVQEELRHTQGRLTLKNKLAHTFLTVPDEQMFGEVLDTLLEATRSEHGVFGYIDEDGALVCPSITRMGEDCHVKGKSARFPHETWGGIWTRALIEKQSLYSNEPGRVPEGHVPIRRVLAVPLCMGTRVIGLFGLANKATDYDDQDKEFVEDVAAYLAPVLDARLQRDIHERALGRTLQAKSILLQEVHHRVKNNLQIISSLLSLQAGDLPQDAQRAFEESQRRVQSMALIHDQLYRTDHPDRLDFGEYAATLTDSLFAAHNNCSGAVRLRQQLDPVLLSLDQAMPCGLILSELLTNSLKHAFKGGRSGDVLIALHCRDDGLVTMRVADNGIGLPPGFNWRQSKSLGLRIANILTVQLSGTLDQAAASGADFTLTFSRSFTH